jgi:cytochrome P450 family 2 subfamily J
VPVLVLYIGLVFSENEAWREHRRFAISCLKDFGMGKVVLQHTVHDELSYLIRTLEKVGSSGAVDPGTWISRAVANIICSIIYGTRFDYDDEVGMHAV